MNLPKVGDRVEAFSPSYSRWVKVTVKSVSTKSFQGIDREYEKHTGLSNWRLPTVKQIIEDCKFHEEKLTFEPPHPILKVCRFCRQGQSLITKEDIRSRIEHAEQQITKLTETLKTCIKLDRSYHKQQLDYCNAEIVAVRELSDRLFPQHSEEILDKLVKESDDFGGKPKYWNPDDFGQPPSFKTDTDGQLTIFFDDSDEPPDPDDFGTIEEYKIAWKQWENLHKKSPRTEEEKAKSSGSLYPYTVNKNNKQYQYWGYCYEVKIEGQWRNRSLHISKGKLEAVRSAIAKSKSVTEIIEIIKEKTK